MRAVAVIPARYGSTRFPGKPLALLLGRPLIAWVVDAARAAEGIAEVWVATDSEPIGAAARAAGARVVLTSPHCASGTDRVAEAAGTVAADVYVNLQGDEPLVEPTDLETLVEVFRASAGGVRMATLARPLERPEELDDSDAVKVVCDAAGDALYFSRAPIPWYRDGAADRPAAQIHLGIYGFTHDALLAFADLPRGVLEEAEKLEQLRALEAGWKVRVCRARTPSVGVDRPADLARAERALRARREIA